MWTFERLLVLFLILYILGFVGFITNTWSQYSKDEQKRWDTFKNELILKETLQNS